VLFNSYEFLFAFLPVTLAGCFLLARFAGPQAAQLWLTAASVYFYASWNLKYLPLLAVSIAFNCLIARWMLTMPEDRRRWPLRLAIVIDLALLGYYKYANFFVDTVNQASGSHFAIAEICCRWVYHSTPSSRSRSWWISAAVTRSDSARAISCCSSPSSRISSPARSSTTAR